MSRKRRWLTTVLGLSVPGLLGMSGSLPGLPGGSSSPEEDWTVEELSHELVVARNAIESGCLSDAASALSQADMLSLKLTPNGTQTDRLLAKKRGLWEQPTQARAKRRNL
jgi:hypothetical protein